jgi:hypothetical protein
MEITLVIPDGIELVGPSADPVAQWLPIGAAVIAAGAAVVVAVVSAWFQRRTSLAEQESLEKQRKIAYHRRQLDELYGEMSMLRIKSRRAWNRLRSSAMFDDLPKESADWFRMIDHIEEIRADLTGRENRIGQDIIDTNARLARLMETRASLLVVYPPPESFGAFLDHQSGLARLWEMGKNRATDEEERPFPAPQIDEDIEAAIKTINGKLAALGATG